MRRIPVITTKFCTKRTNVRVEGKTLVLELYGDGDGADPWGFLNGDRNSSRVDVDGADSWDFFPEPQYGLLYN
jgi:hypothetical protein